jgi:hypothetical protein
MVEQMNRHLRVFSESEPGKRFKERYRRRQQAERGFLDWLEVQLRRLWGFVQKVWRASFPGKVAVVVVALVLATATIYIGYLLLFGGSLF